ncbi:MAG: bifunctional tRNA (5-methylaminomethyl-2-thiouridine)(34)-methyltransferase MnmD/FAD-dependent 5-carboxymethylaminomethyl-2-thiouridine(34) oxidoreductase MnmC [Alcanivoracaceae bacterium]|nr:bifunctional tRNA (5-methylaminomethyl-2-thiouridine)(34)-methyltransferase MnmD/FAD-dependent 5-carboxymethylaminomethyl-2-thiouridine(34) oxidoreductase MnmC [Alcanivoracaceae bacterium]
MINTPFPIRQINSLDLSFDDSGSAYSNNYSDIYFQSGIGQDEKKHVFLSGNDLPENWQGKVNYTIAETGFGTGLNFLNTLELWHKNKQANQHLHFISCELHPLNKLQLQQLLAQFPTLAKYSEQLISQYPQYLMYGFHRLHFEELNVTLTLIFADCIDAFEQLESSIDAWFLDGFGPSKNPDMWSQRLFKAIARLSHIGTTVATFTVARKIRDHLSSVGFSIKKINGFGQKREMLTAQLTREDKPIEKQPWAQTFKSSDQNSYAVLGAGIAGLSIAQKLQKQGKAVTLIDRQKLPCRETSGNPQAMIMPSFSLNDSIESRFYLAAFQYAIRHYSDAFYHATGVHELAFTDKQQIWQDKLLCRFDLPKELVYKHQNGLLYTQAGWLDTQGHAMNIFNQLHNYLQAEITKIHWHNDQWHLYTGNDIVHSATTLVLANGINITKILSKYEMPVTAKHGQISYFKSTDIDPQIANAQHLQLNNGYITPSWNGIQTMGATFDHVADNDRYKKPITTKDHWQRNLLHWQNTPYVGFFDTVLSHQSRAGIRVTTPDHLPICGALINQAQFKKDYHDIHHGKHWQTYPQPQQIKNLYLLTGLGSRGFTSAPILAEFLCNQMLGQTHVLDKLMQKCIHPNRFLYRALSQQKT